MDERLEGNESVTTLGRVSTRDNRVLKGPLGRSLHSLTLLTRSAALRFATLRSRARSLTSLTPSWDG